MKRLILLLGMAAQLAQAVAWAAEAAQPKAPTMETVIVGDRDSAVGLYLLPWKEEAASDIDLPPRLHEVPAQALETSQFARHVGDEEANAAYRRVRVEPR